MLLTGKKKECRLLSVMPADSIAAAAQKGGLRHVLPAARGQTQCPSIQHTTLVRLSEGPRSGAHTGRRGKTLPGGPQEWGWLAPDGPDASPFDPQSTLLVCSSPTAPDPIHRLGAASMGQEGAGMRRAASSFFFKKEEAPRRDTSRGSSIAQWQIKGWRKVPIERQLSVGVLRTRRCSPRIPQSADSGRSS